MQAARWLLGGGGAAAGEDIEFWSSRNGVDADGDSAGCLKCCWASSLGRGSAGERGIVLLA